MDQDYSSSLSGATEALRASTLRLPVVCGARVHAFSFLLLGHLTASLGFGDIEILNSTSYLYVGCYRQMSRM